MRNYGIPTWQFNPTRRNARCREHRDSLLLFLEQALHATRADALLQALDLAQRDLNRGARDGVDTNTRLRCIAMGNGCHGHGAYASHACAVLAGREVLPGPELNLSGRRVSKLLDLMRTNQIPTSGNDAAGDF